MTQPGKPAQSDKHEDAPQDAHADAGGAIHQHGVPVDASDEEPTGYPTSDRHHSETAPSEKGGSAAAPKHEHLPPGKASGA
jgi:hypothetical protein